MYRAGRMRNVNMPRIIGFMVILCGVAIISVIIFCAVSAANTPVAVKGTILQMDEKSIEVIVNPIQSYEPGEKITAAISANTQILDSGKLVTQNSLKIGMYINLTVQTGGTAGPGSALPALKIEIIR